MNENNMLKNIDRIKSLSKLMSNDNNGVDTDKILNAIAAAKSMGMLTAQDNSEKMILLKKRTTVFLWNMKQKARE